MGMARLSGIIIFSIILLLQLTIIQGRVCEPYLLNCQGNSLMVCSPSGDGWGILEECEHGCLEGACFAEKPISESIKENGDTKVIGIDPERYLGTGLIYKAYKNLKAEFSNPLLSVYGIFVSLLAVVGVLFYWNLSEG